MDYLESYKEALRRLEELNPKKLGFGVYHQDARSAALGKIGQVNCFCAVGALAPAAFTSLLSVDRGFNGLGISRLICSHTLPYVKHGPELKAELNRWDLEVLRDLQKVNDHLGVDETSEERYARVVQHVKKQIARMERGGI